MGDRAGRNAERVANTRSAEGIEQPRSELKFDSSVQLDGSAATTGIQLSKI